MQICACPCLVGLLCLLGSAPDRAAGPADGIYPSQAEGRLVRRNGGTDIILGPRVGKGLGKATIGSIRNDNSAFVLRLKGAGPVAAGAKPPLAVVLDGVCVVVWGQSDRQADGTMDLSAHIYGERAARKVAARLKVPLQRRKAPGHRFRVRWSPDKESYQVGETITLKMELRNVGTRPFTFRVGGQQRGPRDNQFRFLAYHGYGGGKAVPDTGDPTNFGGISSYRTLKPGESLTATVPLDRWFQFTEPDTYRVTGLYQLELYERPAAQGVGEVIWDDVAAGDCLVRVVRGKP
jgi:hypothetical protein